jgi:hypothetical protein
MNVIEKIKTKDQKAQVVTILLFVTLSGLLCSVAMGLLNPVKVLTLIATATGLGIALWGLWYAVSNPWLPFFAFLSMNLLVYIVPKADYLVAALGLVTGLVYVLKDFRNLLQKPMWLSFFIFSLIGFIYWMTYSTDFVVSKIVLQNGNIFKADTNNEMAKTIVLLATLSPLVSISVVINAVKNSRPILLTILRKYYAYFAVIYSCITFVFSASSTKLDIAGRGLILPLVFLFNTYFWLNIRDKSTRCPEMLYWVVQLCLLLSVFLEANKTTFLGLLLGSAIYIYGIKMIYGFSEIGKLLSRLFNNKPITTVLIISLLLLFVLAYCFGFFDLLASKMDYFYKGLSKQSTLNVRTSNWSYFFTDWQDKLNIKNIIFGFGAAVSRETIFYISAMRHSFPNNNNLVQTLHNSYLEFVYDFGLMAVFYYFPTWYLLQKHVKRFFLSNQSQLQQSSLSIIVTIVFVGFYALMDGVKIQVSIFYYFLLILYDEMLLNANE